MLSTFNKDFLVKLRLFRHKREPLRMLTNVKWRGRLTKSELNTRKTLEDIKFSIAEAAKDLLYCLFLLFLPF